MIVDSKRRWGAESQSNPPPNQISSWVSSKDIFCSQLTESVKEALTLQRPRVAVVGSDGLVADWVSHERHQRRAQLLPAPGDDVRTTSPPYTDTWWLGGKRPLTKPGR